MALAPVFHFHGSVRRLRHRVGAIALLREARGWKCEAHWHIKGSMREEKSTRPSLIAAAVILVVFMAFQVVLLVRSGLHQGNAHYTPAGGPNK